MRTPALAAVLFSLILGAVSSAAAALSVTLVSVVSTVSPGETQTLVIQSDPGASCQGSVLVPGKGARAGFELHERVANNKGIIEWKWPVSGAPGAREVTVTCSKGEDKGTLHASFSVH